MLLGARQFFERRGAPTPPLPYDAEVEYLESTGTQWIDTGLVATYDNSFGAELNFVPTVVNHGGTGTTSTVCVCGANSSPNTGFELRWQYFSSSITLGGSYGSPAGGSVTANDLVNRSVVARNINGVITYDVDGVRIVDKTAIISNSGFVQGSVILFGVRRGSTVQGVTLLLAKMKHAKFSLGNVLVQDLIPVRFTNELGQSEGAMYDRVSGQLFRNAGTGVFTIGPDKTSWTNPYVTDGLIAMWDGEWNAGGGVHDPNATSWVDLSNNGHHLQSSDFRWIDNALDDTASNIRIDLGNLSSSFPSAITMESAVRCPNFRNNAFIFDFYNHSDAGCTMYTTSLASPFACRCQVRNGSLNSNSSYSPCDSNYNITTSLAWAETEERYRVYFFGESISNGYSVQFITPPIYFVLGASNNTYQNFRGYVYSLRLYNRALTAAEVAANYAIDKARFNLP